jgi:hypothetical protein
MNRTATVDDLIEDDTKEAPATPDQLAVITSTCEELRQLQRAIIKGEALIEEQKAEARRLSETVLPSLFDTAGVRMLSLEDDTVATLGEKVYASISKANAPVAAGWLEENGYGALVKTKLMVEFEKGDAKRIAAAEAALLKAKIAYEMTSAVHPATLLAFVKESLVAGRTLPPEIAHHEQPTVELKQPKVKKGKK